MEGMSQDIYVRVELLVGFGSGAARIIKNIGDNQTAHGLIWGLSMLILQQI